MNKPIRPFSKCEDCGSDWTYDTCYSQQIDVKSCDPCGLVIDRSEYDGVGVNAKKLAVPLNLRYYKGKVE